MSVDIRNITIDIHFRKNLEFAHSIPKIPKNYGILLDIYGLKQTVEVGKVNKDRPLAVNIRGTLKYDAWKKHENKDEIEAKKQVIQLINDWKRNNN